MQANPNRSASFTSPLPPFSPWPHRPHREGHVDLNINTNITANINANINANNKFHRKCNNKRSKLIFILASPHDINI